MPLRVVLEVLLTELGVGATNSVATREAVPIFLERRAMFGGACNGAAGAGNVETCGRSQMAPRNVVRVETRQVYFRAELGFLEGTPLCPCLIRAGTSWYRGTVFTRPTLSGYLTKISKTRIVKLR